MLKLSSCFTYLCIIIYFVASLYAVIMMYGQQIMAWSLGNTSQISFKVLALGHEELFPPPHPNIWSRSCLYSSAGVGEVEIQAGWEILSQKNSKGEACEMAPRVKAFTASLRHQFNLGTTWWKEQTNSRSYPDFSHMHCDSSIVRFKVRWGQ